MAKPATWKRLATPSELVKREAQYPQKPGLTENGFQHPLLCDSRVIETYIINLGSVVGGTLQHV